MPPEGARPARFTTFAVVDCPLATIEGANTTELTCAVVSLTVAVAIAPLTPLRPAKIVTVVFEPTAAVSILKLGEAVAPAATVADAGTDAIAGLEAERLNTRPPAGAGLARVTLLGE